MWSEKYQHLKQRTEKNLSLTFFLLGVLFQLIERTWSRLRPEADKWPATAVRLSLYLPAWSALITQPFFEPQSLGTEPVGKQLLLVGPLRKPSAISSE